MADSALLEREIQKITGEKQDLVEKETSEAEREHRRMMSQNFQNLLERHDEYDPYESSKTYDFSDRAPAYQQPEYVSTERHAPVVPNSPDAPSASNRINDFLQYQRSLDEMRMRSGEKMERQNQVSMQNSYAPVEAPAQNYAPMQNFYAPVEAPAEDYAPSYEEELYREGVLMERMLSPDVEPVEAPVFSPSYMPEKTSEEDALPTRQTLETIHREEAEDEQRSSFFTALSPKTKIILAAIAAAIALLIAVISINTAILKSINAGVAQRELEIAGLTQTLTGIESEISDLTSPENIENWAIEHGMTPPES